MRTENDVTPPLEPGIHTTTRSSLPAAVQRVSWAAIFAGVTVALVVQLLLGVLGIAIGASTIDPLSEQNPAAGLGTGAGVWSGPARTLSKFSKL